MAYLDQNGLSQSDKKKEDWMNSKWRPMMGWMYMCICMFDFMIAPILWSLIQAFFHGGITTQWQPLTLQGAGLFHVAMGAVLGLSAYGRTQEKMAGANNGGVQFPPNAGTTYIPPGQGMAVVSNQPGGFGGQSNGFGTQPGGATAFGSPAPGGFGASSGFGSPSPATSGFGNTPLGGNSASGFGGSGFGGASATSPSPAPVAGGFGSGFSGGSCASPVTPAPTVTPKTPQQFDPSGSPLGPHPAPMPPI